MLKNATRKNVVLCAMILVASIIIGVCCGNYAQAVPDEWWRLNISYEYAPGRYPYPIERVTHYCIINRNFEQYYSYTDWDKSFYAETAIDEEVIETTYNNFLQEEE